MTYEKFKEYMKLNAFELALLELGEDVYGLSKTKGGSKKKHQKGSGGTTARKVA